MVSDTSKCFILDFHVKFDKHSINSVMNITQGALYCQFYGHLASRPTINFIENVATYTHVYVLARNLSIRGRSS